MTRRMILPDRVFGMSGTIQTFFGRATLPIWISIAALTLSSISGLAESPGLEGDVHFDHPAADLVYHGDGGRLGHLGHGQHRRFELLRPEPVPGDVDDVVDAAEYAVVAVLGLHGPVAAQERPVVPVVAGACRGSTWRNRSGQSARVGPTRFASSPGHGLRMQMLPALAAAGFHHSAVLVVYDGVNPEGGWAAAAWFHWLEGRQGAGQGSRLSRSSTTCRRWPPRPCPRFRSTSARPRARWARPPCTSI